MWFFSGSLHPPAPREGGREGDWRYRETYEVKHIHDPLPGGHLLRRVQQKGKWSLESQLCSLCTGGSGRDRSASECPWMNRDSMLPRNCLMSLTSLVMAGWKPSVLMGIQPSERRVRVAWLLSVIHCLSAHKPPGSQATFGFYREHLTTAQGGRTLTFSVILWQFSAVFLTLMRKGEPPRGSYCFFPEMLSKDDSCGPGWGWDAAETLAGACEWTPPKSYRTQGPGPSCPTDGSCCLPVPAELAEWMKWHLSLRNLRSWNFTQEIGCWW